MRPNVNIQDIPAADATVRDICREYGLYGRIVYFEPTQVPESDRCRFYILAGVSEDVMKDPLPNHIQPEELVRKQARNLSLFYPDCFALDMTEVKDAMKSTELLVEYCRKTEFLKSIYGEYSTPLPEKIRESEIEQLNNYQTQANNPDLSESVQERCRKGLKKFFKAENVKGFRRRWLDYFRSEQFPRNKGPIAKILGYFRRKQQLTNIDRLVDENEDLCKIEMQEHQFKAFQKYLKEHYPDVTYAVGEKVVVDHGIETARRIPGSEDVLGKYVTCEEFDVIMKERFATEGWYAISDLRQAYWEFRDVFFKKADEPYVAAAYGAITLAFAKCDPIYELNQSPLHLVDISDDQIMNFVSLAKERAFKFYIDTKGDYSIPSLDYVHVVYQEHQAPVLRQIMDRMFNSKIEDSHLVGSGLKPELNELLRSTRDHVRSAETQEIDPPTNNKEDLFQRE